METAAAASDKDVGRFFDELRQTRQFAELEVRRTAPHRNTVVADLPPISMPVLPLQRQLQASNVSASVVHHDNKAAIVFTDNNHDGDGDEPLATLDDIERVCEHAGDNRFILPRDKAVDLAVDGLQDVHVDRAGRTILQTVRRRQHLKTESTNAIFSDDDDDSDTDQATGVATPAQRPRSSCTRVAFTILLMALAAVSIAVFIGVYP
jgi:hypothetical protein